MSAPQAQQPGWWEECYLWGQLNLQEPDPAAIDLERWKRIWRRTRIDGVTLNAGGIVYFYPSAHDLNWRSPWLGERDLFGELVKAAKEVGLRVLARFTPSRVHERVAIEHPDWCLTDASGQPVPDPGHDPGHSGRMYHACLNGPYYRSWIPEVVFPEVFERYDVDGFFFTSWLSADRVVGPCHCRACQDGFRRATGFGLPPLNDWGNDAWRAWLEWRSDSLCNLADQWMQATEFLKSSATVVLNLGGGIDGIAARGKNWKRFFFVQDLVDADQPARGTGEPIWQIGATGRIMRALAHPKPYFHRLGAYGGTGRIAAQPAAEQTLMLAEIAASGSRPWYHVIGASGEDRRPLEAIERFYDWYHRHRDYYRGSESAAEIALVFNHRLLDNYGQDDPQQRVEQPWRGAYAALVRARLPFDMVQADEIGESLSRYRALILPNQAYMTFPQMEVVRQYVRNGGSVLATFETSRYDEDGIRMDEYALADLFGVRTITRAPVQHRQPYVRVEDREALGRGLEGTRIVAAPELSYCPVAPAGDVRAALTLIPHVPESPSERAFPRLAKTSIPLALLRHESPNALQPGGRVVFFPFDLDRLLAVSRGHPDLCQLFLNGLHWALGKPLSVTVEGPGILDVHVYRQRPRDRLLIHLVNCTNPELWRPPATEITPVGEQTVTLRLPEGEQVHAARLLWRGEEAQVRPGDEGAVKVIVPGVEAYEVVVVDLSRPALRL
jgi:hypothetical protein